jgi:3-phosphoshikimate 1-carboxyvinyltransferase
VNLRGGKELRAPGTMVIPGDISSCAFFIVAALLVPGSRLRIRKVGLNPTRTAVLSLLQRMGAHITIIQGGSHCRAYEPYADILVQSSPLEAITLSEKEVAYAIDELPILCVAACFARGTTRMIGAQELRIKETDRIYSMVHNLRKMGAQIKNVGNDLIIEGTGVLRPAALQSYGDHRTAMSLAVAGLLCEGKSIIKNTRCIHKSFPDFIKILRSITN